MEKRKYRVSTITAIKRLFRIAYCSHRNQTIGLEIKPYMITYCRGCGRVLEISSEGERSNNLGVDDYGDRTDWLSMSKKKRNKLSVILWNARNE